MIALDADVLSEYLHDNPAYVARIHAIPQNELFVPVVVAEEILRGRLDLIRRAEAARTKITLEQAYHFFAVAVAIVARIPPLLYTTQADEFFEGWRKAKLRIGTHDLRIAAICSAHSATLATRNRRDFNRVPGLLLEVWETPPSESV